MTKIYLNLAAIALFLLSTCSVDYKINIWPERQCIIVNSILQPDSLIAVRFYALTLKDNKNEVIPLTGSLVRFEENGNVLYDGISDSTLQLNIFPEACRRYAIECDTSYFIEANENIYFKI